MNKASRVFHLGLALIMFTSCRFPAPDISIKRRVDEKEVVGVWKISEDSLSLAKRYGYSPLADTPHTIELRADHTVKFASVHPFAPYETSTLVMEGTWRLEFKEVSILSLDLNRMGVNYRFTESDNGHLVLWNIWGDPDEGEYLRYEKTVHELPQSEMAARKSFLSHP